ncbi:oligosaccharide flippase family protein, partial [Sphingomonas sp. SRS2]|uniref:oligosaccharide flippase family protein n=1 Tax=Sphingomonas sp. SRS2 TaxID=133190 RepID=UPI00061847B5
MSFWKQSIHSGAYRIVGAVLAFLVSVINARWLGPTELGLLITIMATIAVASRILSFGLTQAAQYFAANEAGNSYRNLPVITLISLSLCTLALSILASPISTALSIKFFNIDQKSAYDILIYNLPLYMFNLHISLYI